MLGLIVMGAVKAKIDDKQSLIIWFTVLIGSLIRLQIAPEAWMLFLSDVIYGFAHGGRAIRYRLARGPVRHGSISRNDRRCSGSFARRRQLRRDRKLSDCLADA